ncbi:hypothetical protein ABIB95_005696 [Bradyrhizobium sp. LA2.1]
MRTITVDVKPRRRLEYDAASDTFRPATVADNRPQENDAKCEFACNTVEQNRDSQSGPCQGAPNAQSMTGNILDTIYRTACLFSGEAAATTALIFSLSVSRRSCVPVVKALLCATAA